MSGDHGLEAKLSEKQRQIILQNHPLTDGKDLGTCILLMFVTFVSWLTPERLWHFFTVTMARMYLFIFQKAVRSRIETIGKICGDRLKITDARKIEIERKAKLFEARFQYMREYRPGGWKPCFHIYGKQHIENALERGQGAILWIAPFHFVELAIKKGLAQRGFNLTYLSDYRHGLSTTRFGLKFLNPLWKKAENKYLHERIVIQPDGQLGYLRTLEKRLRQNALVAMGSIPSKGQKTIPTKILNGTFPFPPGAASLALATKASLLPVFLIQRSPGELKLTIEAPINIPSKKNRHENIDIIMDKFSGLIEDYVIQYPTSFRFWDHGKVLEKD